MTTRHCTLSMVALGLIAFAGMFSDLSAQNEELNECRNEGNGAGLQYYRAAGDYYHYTCDDTGSPCLSDRDHVCLPWATPDSGSRKLWFVNQTIGQCVELTPLNGQVECQVCLDDDRAPVPFYCAQGKKYSSQTDCDNDTNGVTCWGYTTGCNEIDPNDPK